VSAIKKINMNDTIKITLNNWLKSMAAELEEKDYQLLENSTKFIVDQAAETTQEDELLATSLGLAKKSQQYQISIEMLATLLCLPTLKHLKSMNKLNDMPETIDKSITDLSQKLFKTIVIDDIAATENHIFTQNQNQNRRKMLLAVVEDPRVIVIKLIECIYTLHSIKHDDIETQQKFAHKVMNVYAPLANRLGLGQIKWELEDIAFRYLHPDEYFNISKSLKLKRRERVKTVDIMTNELNRLINTTKITGTSIDGRVKHIYSIAKKMKRKDNDFNNIFDTTALRVLAPTIENCYEILSIIHNNWENIPEEFDDYISKPKANGYQSIHTAILTKDMGCIEIQIRTYLMHEESEIGVAAHWKYKENPSTKDRYQEKIHLLRQVINWQKTINGEKEENSLNSITNDKIYVFSPQGQIYELPQDATPLDFAYRVHTEIGHRCRGAKINDKLVTLKNKLSNGDWVDIITSKINRPSRDWLNPKNGYVTSSHSINKIKHFFRKENYQDNLNKGQEIWDKAHRQNKIERNKINEVVKYFNLTSPQDLLTALGAGDIGIAAIINKTKEQEKAAVPQIKTLKINESKTNDKILIDGVTGLLNQVAQCCNPIPGDAIVGYITKEKGISIHKANCKNIINNAAEFNDRMVNASWGDLEEFFIINLYMECLDKKGLINDISNKIVKHDCRLLSLNTKIDETNYTVIINLQLQVKSTEQYNKIKQDLYQLSSVITISRN
jgi:GTP pyrophosphokinase